MLTAVTVQLCAGTGALIRAFNWVSCMAGEPHLNKTRTRKTDTQDTKTCPAIQRHLPALTRLQEPGHLRPQGLLKPARLSPQHLLRTEAASQARGASPATETPARVSHCTAHDRRGRGPRAPSPALPTRSHHKSSRLRRQREPCSSSPKQWNRGRPGQGLESAALSFPSCLRPLPLTSEYELIPVPVLQCSL